MLETYVKSIGGKQRPSLGQGRKESKRAGGDWVPQGSWRQPWAAMGELLAFSNLISSLSPITLIKRTWQSVDSFFPACHSSYFSRIFLSDYKVVCTYCRKYETYKTHTHGNKKINTFIIPPSRDVYIHHHFIECNKLNLFI